MATRTEDRVRSQNATLLCEVLDQGESQLRRQARRHAPGAADVEDILQRSYELFIERFDPRYEPLAWLHTTVKREAWGLMRRAYRRYEIPICTQTEPQGPGYDLAECVPDDKRGPGELALERDRDRQIRRGVRDLKPDERTALGLLALGYSYEEIAQLKGWTHTKVNRCISEGRATLRSRFAEAGGST